ncbi:pilus assembly protein PilO [Egbenema bharatensis]|uniref:pilus assembly protein PilO n=1 Tax=Egbenema bharatensis TaxID=3463334 RepID=UPI003A877DE4
MTAGGDFIPTGDPNEFEEPSYPKLFGLSLTPTVSGILLALLGLGAAIWLWSAVVQPSLQRNQELRTDVATKRQQLIDQEETQRQIQEAQNRLTEAEQLQSDVLGLFATQRSLDTLLLDVNERVQSANAGIQDPARRANLVRFDLNSSESGVVTDGSYGSTVDGRLRRQVYDVEIEGTFPQVVSIVRSIERLQPLLVVGDLTSQLDTTTQRLVLNPDGQVAAGQPEPRINAAFQLAALVPVEQTAPQPTEQTDATEETEEAETAQ